MSKRLHPIRKMLKELGHRHSASAPASDRDIYQRTVARHVKPLLDALESQHPGAKPGAACADCRLLAAWKERL